MEDSDDSIDEETRKTKGALSLYALKLKICEVIRQFYGDETHSNNTDKMGAKRFRLTSHSQAQYNSTAPPEIGPHDIVLSSVNMRKFKFEQIFSEHLHNLVTISNRCGRSD